MASSSIGKPSFGYSVHTPSPALAGVVDYLWALTDAPAHSMECILPSGTLEIVINLHDDEFRVRRPGSIGTAGERFRGAMVSGAYSGAFVAETRAHASIIGVHFKPGAATSVLGVAASELANSHVELEALWGRRAAALRERLCDAVHTAQRFRILEQALIDCLTRPGSVRREVSIALGMLSAPRVEVSGVARRLELSHRRFIELFTEHVGMAPKRYSRVRRFQSALSLLKNRAEPAWARIALECGYSDQSHLCRDWVEFTGVSPEDFLLLSNVRVKDNHLALSDSKSKLFKTVPHAVRKSRVE